MYVCIASVTSVNNLPLHLNKLLLLLPDVKDAFTHLIVITEVQLKSILHFYFL